MVAQVIFFTSGTTWTVPVGCTLITSAECIGGGGGGDATWGNGGGGAAYSKVVNFAVTPGTVKTYSIGGGGGTNGSGASTWIRLDTGATPPASTAQGCLAAAGAGAPAANASGGAGGAAGSCIGTTTAAGGAGGGANN